MSYVIYGLEDPRDALYHYVGVTDDVYERFHAHIRGSSGNIQKNGWIFECRQANVMIVMQEIERVENSSEEALQREKYWIGYYIDLGHPLKNMQVARTLLKDKARMERLVRISTKRKEAEVRKVAKANNPPIVEKIAKVNNPPTVEKIARVRNMVEEELYRLRPKALEAWEMGYRSRLAMAQYLGIRENRARQLCNELMKERAVVINEEEMRSKAKAAWDAGCRSRYSIMKHAGIPENRARRFLKEFTCESLAQMEEPPSHQIISELKRGTQAPEYLGA